VFESPIEGLFGINGMISDVAVWVLFARCQVRRRGVNHDCLLALILDDWPFSVFAA